MSIFDNIKEGFDSVTDGIANFKNGMDEFGKEWNEIWVDGRNDLKAICKEGGEDLRKSVEENASNINYYLGETVVNINNGFEVVEDILETAGNGFWAVSKKVITPFELNNEVRSWELNLGDHIFVDYGVFTHHGLYSGYEEVIHYAPVNGNKAEIHKCPLDEFANGRKIYRCSKDESPVRFKAEKVIERAHGRLGETTYNLLNNNCENFVRWCRFGRED